MLQVIHGDRRGIDDGFCQVCVSHGINVEAARFGAISFAFDIGDKCLARVIRAGLAFEDPS